MFHHLLVTWFNFVHDWGYLGVFLLMALESSIVPLPSEVVMPPAAYWASQGAMNFWLVVLAGAAGSYFGAILSYAFSRAVGAPVIKRYGRFFLMNEDKLALAEAWLETYGAVGVFVARLLPVVRHLISIPAGILRMNVLRFSLTTILGAFAWCAILSWFGREVIGNSPDLLTSPDALILALKHRLQWFVAAVLIFAGLYAVVAVFKRRMKRVVV
jgi:membrane protein DedA with SNARE-associated domain